MIRFTVHTEAPAPRGWIHVVVHDTTEELRAAAAAHSRRAGVHTSLDDAEACFQAAAYEATIDDDGYVTTPAAAYAGVLRLTPEHGTGVIAHEATHAALAIYQRQFKFTLGGDDDMDDEEPLAYAVGDIVAGVCEGLVEHGVWD